MAAPEGKLTPVQFEIMQLVWDSEQGLTTAEIWDAIRTGRDVSRTTILNLVDRLEKRGWLHRHKEQGPFRYTAAVERQSAQGQLAADFVEEFFDGSATNLVLSLIGNRRVSKADLQRLKQLLNEKDPGVSGKQGKTT